MPTASSSSTFAPSASDIIVLDNGASHLRLWSTAVPHPLVLPNFIGRSRSTRTTYLPAAFSASCKDLGGLHLRIPFERGHIIDWPALKLIWDDAFRHLLALPAAASGDPKGKAKARLLEGKTVIVTEPYFDFAEEQDALDTVLFEEYGADAIWRCTPAQLAVWDEANSANPPGSAAANRAEAQRAQKESPAGPAAAAAATATSTPPPPKKTRSRPSASATPAAASTLARRLKLVRPECTVVVDLGFSYTHAVPLVRNDVCWSAVRRLDLGGKLLTNLLKETLSFRQWDMMDETYLTNVVKERCCFVAAASGASPRAPSSVGRDRIVRDMQARRPSEWTFAELIEYCKATGGGRLRQEWKLPDYETVPQSDDELYGYIQSGPGSKDERDRWQRRNDEDGGGVGHSSVPDDDQGRRTDAFIGTVPPSSPSSPASNSARAHARKRRRASTASSSSSSGRGSSSPSHDAEAGEQILTLTTERFTVPESLFDPRLVGLDQCGVAELVSDAIAAMPETYREMAWSNILLIGGCARMVGLERRMRDELRALAPLDVPVRVRMAQE
ncbi:uncharacterized protein PFL1_01172 [Pseudozyma flocculosa PF-1]|uniref:uncharacterized protein n=1 Tax=Pseudozyma flocculosa PF-1 TaxID=1277687 RepID=UPI00045600FB|nr:uncharacterized protein PFL1_01172 [Pseudozyma flocculosa PF-1]EPQ30983.1 hypothetical protein PFL1_01172 [Pseudozyma flocculosa PF-1]